MNISTNYRAPTDSPRDSLLQLSTFSDARPSLKPLTDGALVARTRAGDPRALEELLGRHGEYLLRLARRYVREEDDARDVLQDVFVTTWKKLPGFEGRSQVGSWLYRVTVNASLMHLRGRSRRPELLATHDPDRLLDGDRHRLALESSAPFRPDQQLESQELRRILQQAIDRLPQSLRSVFELRDLQGWSTSQTAHLLGISLSAVKTRLHRARRILRADIERYLVQ
jgi:RNA polymerase sigma-70 factor (ECF subfamily)